MLYDEFNSYKNFAGADVFKNKALEKTEILKNLNPAFPAREYQKEALGRFYYYCEEYPQKQSPIHLMFNMATGSGKTLIMAANILYFYQKGYRNFIFFVHRNNILKKTLDNFLNPLSKKYLFVEKIILDGKEIKIRPVDNFETVSMDDINIMFCTINILHNRLVAAHENSLTEEDFDGKKIVLIADEAHHYQAYSKIKNTRQMSLLEKEVDVSGLSKEEEEEMRAWEITIMKKILPKLNAKGKRENILLEYTATMDLENPGIKEKYDNKIIYKYDLAEFREDKYSKEIEVLQASMKPTDRALQAILLSQYRRKVAGKTAGMDLKPIVLLKSKTIAESQKNEADFYKMIKNLNGDAIAKISSGQSSSLKKAFEFFDKNKTTLNNLAKELQTDFAPEKCVAVNSKEDSEEKQILLNSLEDKNNGVRAIFVVDMLNEGWDVLNLFDIVRLYDTRDAKSGKPGKTTMAEAQLIGRGARYFPFKLEESQNVYQRKYDNDLENDLRILEQLYYHCSHNPKYLDEIKNALKKTGIMAKESKEVDLILKKGFEDGFFWKKGKIFLNKKFAVDKTKRNKMSDFGISGNYVFVLPTGRVEEEEVLNNQFSLKQQDSTIGKMKIKLGEINQNIIRTAMDTIPFYSFDNLKRYFPSLQSARSFREQENYLSKVMIEISGRMDDLENIKTYEPESFDNVFKAVCFVLDKIANEIVVGNKEFKGSKDFLPEMIQKRLRNKKISFDISNGRIASVEAMIDISQKKWFAHTDFYGTSTERDFLQFFDGFYEELSKKYTDIILIRNEQFWPIYNFSDGQAFYPDFILFLRRGNKKIIQSLQIFIEPKGEIYAKAEPWKEQLLLKLADEGKIRVEHENEKFKILGMPFYNEKTQNIFEEAFTDKLLS